VGGWPVATGVAASWPAAAARPTAASDVPRRFLHATPAVWDDDDDDASKKASAPPAGAGSIKRTATSGGSSSRSKAVVAQEGSGKKVANMVATVQRMPGQVASWSKATALEVRKDPKIVVVWSQKGWKTVKHVAHHTWTGLKLLAAESRIASRILMRLLQGRAISRRERSLLQRVVTDLLRLIPFSFFIIIPALEIFLPVALWLFPNMMPSQFADEKQEADKKKRRLQVLVDSAKFLADCLERDVLGTLQENSHKNDTMDLSDFVARLRAGQPVPNELIFKIATHFKDEFLLDNLPRGQLIAMCSFLHVEGPFGPDVHVRYLLRRRVRQIQADDKEIFWEGLDSLSEAEVTEACELRGIRTDKSVFEARRMLGEWLELSTRQDLPMSLLLFSRAAEVAGYDRRLAGEKQAKDLKEVVTSLPDSVVDELLEEEGGSSKVSRERKLELLKEQEKLVLEEQVLEEALQEEKDEIKRKKKKEEEKKKKDKDKAAAAQQPQADAAALTDADSVGGAATVAAAAEAAAVATSVPAAVKAEAAAQEQSKAAQRPAEGEAKIAPAAGDTALAASEKNDVHIEEEEEEEEEEDDKSITLDGRESLSLDEAEQVRERRHFLSVFLVCKM
jgi:LETM1 and EF-hand domain-containing protein 1